MRHRTKEASRCSLRLTRLGATLLLLGLGAGCRSFEAATPRGFVELEDQHGYDYRATTADGVVLAVRAIEHEPKGELTFWVDAVERQLRQRSGYALLETRDVRTAEGLTGKQLRFGHDEGSRPHLYYVTLFVTDSKLYVLEAGGQREAVTRQEKQIDWAVTSFQAK